MAKGKRISNNRTHNWIQVFVVFDATTILLFALGRFLFQTANNYCLSAVSFRSFIVQSVWARAVCCYHTLRCQAAPLLKPRAFSSLSQVEFELNHFVPIVKKHVARWLKRLSTSIPCGCSWVLISSGSQISPFSHAWYMFCNVCCLTGWWIRYCVRSI